MSALIKLSEFRGGAPLSMYEYKKTLEKQGWFVAVAGEKKSNNLEEYIYPSDTKCFDVAMFNERSFVSIIRTTILIYRAMKEMQATLLLCASRNDFTPCSCVCKATGTALIPIIPGGSINPKAKNMLHVKRERFICFSPENKADLISAGIPKHNIHVVSNRITCEPDDRWKQHYTDRCLKEELCILLTSRLDSMLVSDVLAFMNTISELNKDGIKVQLRIAGSGNQMQRCMDKAKEINQANPCITMLGYLQNLVPEIYAADVVIGKGRSVIMPIMMNRIGLILGKNGALSICDDKTFENLYQYNFSGREMKKTISVNELAALFSQIRSNQEFVASFEVVFDMVRHAYNVDYLPQKFLPIVEQVLSDTTTTMHYGKMSMLKAIGFACISYFKWVLHSLSSIGRK